MESPINSNSESFRGFFIENVSKFCDKCGTAYKPDNIEIVSESAASVIIQAQCDNCKSIYMAHVIKPLQMTKKVPIRLDISAALLQPYYQLGPLDSDEVLSLRKKIAKTETLPELLELFGQKKEKKPRKKASVEKTS
jgi:hypothetical protein